MTNFDKEKYNNKLEKLAFRLTEGIGSATSIVIHSMLFVAIFALRLFGIGLDDILLILTTAVSLEAIYLAIFIQMTVNRNTQSLEEVEEDIDEIQKDVDEIEKDVDEIEKDVDEIQKDIDEVQEDVEEMAEDEDDDDDDDEEKMMQESLSKIEGVLTKLISDIEELKNKR